MKQGYFHFTLGPVQGFVAQARRTRDFWAGSFILSWLSAVAMRAVTQQGGRIDFPQPDEEFMNALVGGKRGPTQGTIPNRFKASVPSDFLPARVEQAVRGAWNALAEHVWDADLEQMARPETRLIWERQNAGFWDIQWALVDSPDVSNTLDRMKNWRSHVPPGEPGLKCMMMDGWQELSGALRPGRQPDNPTGPDAFWEGLRGGMGMGIETDLREGEMLCAMAFIKRRFARHFGTFRATLPGGLKLLGWSLPSGVPSVHYMAAAPWLALLLGVAARDDEQGARVRTRLSEFHDKACRLTGGHGEWESNIACVRRADGKREWQALDGSVFFDAILENAKLWGKGTLGKTAKETLGKLKDLRVAAQLEPVSPFYAVLLMDGDELGIHMSDRDKQQAITQGLAVFTGQVKAIVEAHNGFLVYAGGDDVLALLPLEDALTCAMALRRHYLGCFASTGVPTSLSGAIEYAHIKMPLGKILHDAHLLLDKVAKEGRGRDAIACRVWKPGGLALQWAMPWACALDGDQVIIEQIAEQFRKGPTGDEGGMASKFFYRIRERFQLLNPAAADAPPILDPDAALDLMAMEYLNSGLVREKGLGMAYAREQVKPLLDQCCPVVRDKNESNTARWVRSNRREPDGALLVRFLARKGVER